MRLRDAKICLNCDEIFEGAVCPKCDECCYRPLTTWLKPMFKDTRRVKLEITVDDPQLEAEAA